MKIARLRTTPIEMPFDPPVGIAGFRTAGLVLVFLESDEGIVGEGLVLSFNANRLSLINELVQSLEPLVVGLELGASGLAKTRLWGSMRSFGNGGISVLAVAAVESALWDLRGKSLGLNVAHVLGAYHAALPVYHSAGLWVTASIDELQRTAQQHLDAGFRAMKMRLVCDAQNPAQDVERVRAVREVVGPNVALMADANQKMVLPQALRLGRLLEVFNLEWLEEPVAAHDHVAEAQIAAALDTPIACGESLYTSKDVLDVMRLRSVDVLMPDLLRMGGPSEFLKAAQLADAFNIPVSSHTYPEMSLALLAASPNANFLEYMDWISPIYTERIELDEGGRAIVPDRPGWGFSFDAAVVQRWSLS
jgi:L-alanine-DL-glutamate epimerase-like enolase superfamily enzyme